MPEKRISPNARMAAASWFLLAATCCALCAYAGETPGPPPALQTFFRPGEARARFQAWEKRARKFEAALTADPSAVSLGAVTARLRLIVADIEKERAELASRYEASLDEGRKRLTESEAMARTGMELGYGADAVRYADNVAAYARALLKRFEARLSAWTPAAPRTAPPMTPPKAP